jgi:hypothetical protein
MNKEEIIKEIGKWESEFGESFVDYTDECWEPLDWASFLRTKGFNDFADEIEAEAKENKWYSMNDGILVHDPYCENSYDTSKEEKNTDLFAEWISIDTGRTKKFIDFIAKENF